MLKEKTKTNFPGKREINKKNNSFRVIKNKMIREKIIKLFGGYTKKELSTFILNLNWVHKELNSKQTKDFLTQIEKLIKNKL